MYGENERYLLKIYFYNNVEYSLHNFDTLNDLKRFLSDIIEGMVILTMHGNRYYHEISDIRIFDIVGVHRTNHFKHKYRAFIDNCKYRGRCKK